MPLPWLRLIDGVLGVSDIARAVRHRSAQPDGTASMETPLVGVVLGALREAFTRDSERLDLERQRLDEERARAERSLQLELLRQAGERELGRLRLMAGAALVSLFGALFLATQLGAIVPRSIAGTGALILLGALAAALSAHAHVSRALALAHPQTTPQDLITAPAARAVPWLFLAGLGVLAVGVLTA